MFIIFTLYYYYSVLLLKKKIQQHHNLTLISRKLTKQRFKYQQESKKVFNIIPNRLINYFKSQFRQLSWSEFLSPDNLDDTAESLMTMINKVKSEFSKNITYSSKKQNLPWFNEQVWALMRQRDYALKTAIKSGLAQDRRIFQQLRNKVVRELRKSKENVFINIINDSKGNSRQTWKNINMVLKKDHNNNKDEGC